VSQIDPRFLQARKQASQRHSRKAGGSGSALGWVGGGVVLAFLVLAGGWLILRPTPPAPVAQAVESDAAILPSPELPDDPATEPELVQLPPQPPQPEPEEEGFRASLDLPGDPLILQLGDTGSGPAPRQLPRPETLPAPRGQGAVLLAQAPLLEAGERLVVNLPTSPEDFAIFQTQRQRRTQVVPRSAQVQQGEAGFVRPRSVAEGRALVGQGDGRVGANAIAMLPTNARMRPFSDSFLKLSRETDLSSLLESEGLPPDEAAQVAQAAAELIASGPLRAGQVLALRQTPARAGAPRFAQLALYDDTRYVGAVGRGDMDDGAPDDATLPLAIAADPWLRQDLPALLQGGAQSGTQATARPRVMDALYASALRLGLSPGQVGQMIMLLAQSHKLDGDATPDHRLTVLFSASPAAAIDATTASDLDQILYIALETGSEAVLRCYVHRPGPDRAPACYGVSRGSGPAAAAGRAGASAPPADTQALTGGDAVEQLVNRIIQVESAGRADARNPLSTATGLGQFIESTWLRMMRTYRPDLSATLSRAELLALRTDPTISREMVLNLAREGESYLRARGHQITAGRLYLAHFLGMEGAHTALSSAADADLLTVFGPGVINANPFLRGRDVAYVLDWAEGKMRGASGRIAIVREPDGLVEFRALVDGLLAAL
jgi:hypothetical protein